MSKWVLKLTVTAANPDACVSSVTSERTFAVERDEVPDQNGGAIGVAVANWKRGASVLVVDASFALAWCSRYEPWERRRSSDRAWFFSFVNVCETLGLDPKRVRTAGRPLRIAAISSAAVAAEESAAHPGVAKAARTGSG